MTPQTDTAAVTGEQRLRSRRNRFLRYCILAFLVALGAGVASGAASSLYLDGALPSWVLIAIWAVMLAGFAWFCRDYYRRIDELDLLDNLWASAIGMYAYFAILASWFFFHEAGLAPPPEHFAIAAATMATSFIAYFARKLTMR